MGGSQSKKNRFLIFKEYVKPNADECLLPINITNINNWYILLLNEYTKLGGSRVLPPSDLNAYTLKLLEHQDITHSNIKRKVANYTYKVLDSLIRNKIISTPLYTGCLNLYTLVVNRNKEYPNNDRIHVLINKLIGMILPKTDCIENNVYKWYIHWKVTVDLPTLLFCIRNYDHLPNNLLDIITLTSDQKTYLRNNIHSLDKKTGEMVLRAMINW